MPSRTSETGDSQTATRRSSLRRLSSIASFQTLFTRRRSRNDTDQTANSSSSNLSMSSITANPPEPAVDFTGEIHDTRDASNLDTTATATVVLPIPATESSRKGYINIPDDPIGGMPRSRTFSNLPLPTRPKKSNLLTSGVSHSRLPSFIPTARLPSAPSLTRAKRSSTQSHPTAFKENMSLSPINPLPAMEIFNEHTNYSSSRPSRTYGPQYTNEAIEPLLCADFSSSPPIASSHPQNPVVSMVRGYKSSPVYRSAKERVPTPGGSKGMDIPRWASQPVLTNTTNIHHASQHPRARKQSNVTAAPASAISRREIAPKAGNIAPLPQNGVSSELHSIEASISQLSLAQEVSLTAHRPNLVTFPNLTGAGV